MPITDSERTSQVHALTNVLGALLGTDPEQLARPDLADLGFAALVPSLRRMREAAQILYKSDLAALPDPVRDMATNGFGYIQSLIREMEIFNIRTLADQRANPLDAQRSLLDRFDQAELAFWKALTPVMGFVTGMRAEKDPESGAEAVRMHVKSIRESDSAVARMKEDMERTLAAAREAVGKIGVSRHATLFGAEAMSHALDAKHWLWAAIGSAVATIAAIGANLWYVMHHTGDVPGNAVLQISLAKILGFSMLITVTLWCGRVYRVSRHNSIVNRHRQNALTTFETFVEAAGADEQTKNAVLLYAAQSIFNPQPSGFTSGESEAGSTPSVVELIRTVAPQSRS